MGGFSEIIEFCEEENITIAGIIDSQAEIEVGNKMYTSLGNDAFFLSQLQDFRQKSIVITPDIPSVRKRIYNLYERESLVFENLISNKATISPSVKFGCGNIVQKLVHISSCVEIGNFVKINVGANVMHDNIIGDFVTIAPNAVLLGRVKVEEGAYIGANATILPNVKIGKNAIVGAGAVVTKDVCDNLVVVGVPAKKQ